MDFAWTEEQLVLRRSVVDFARQHLADDVVSRDHAGAFSMEHWKRCADFGIHGMPFPEEFGGTGHDVLTTMLAMTFGFQVVLALALVVYVVALAALRLLVRGASAVAVAPG